MAGNAAVATPEADARKLAEAKEEKGLEAGDFVPAKMEVAGRDERDVGSPAGLRGDDVDRDDGRGAMKKILGEEEHTAISQVLSMQQEQFEQQVQELHTISHRQWGHVSRTLFPYLESFRHGPGGASLNPAAASPLFAATAMSDQQQAAAVTAMNAQAGQAWWQDPEKVMGMKVMPSLVHASVSNQMQNSSQMESTMIGSHHPSQLFSKQQHQQQQGGQSSAATALGTTGSHQQVGPSGAGSCAQGFGDAGTHGNNRHSGIGSHQTQGQAGPLSGLGGQGIKRSLSNRAQSEGALITTTANDGAKLVEGKALKRQREGSEPTGPVQQPSSTSRATDLDGSLTKVAAPKPKVATPQSAIDILLALSEASTGDAKAASQLRNQQHQIHQTQSKGAQAAAAPAAVLAAHLVSPKDAPAPAAVTDEGKS